MPGRCLAYTVEEKRCAAEHDCRHVAGQSRLTAALGRTVRDCRRIGCEPHTSSIEGSHAEEELEIA